MKIGIIGCGNMGQALLKAMLASRYTSKRNIFCYDKDNSKLKYLRRRLGVGLVSSNSELVKRADVIILAVKPQDLDTVLPQIRPSITGKLLISICAGIRTARLEKSLGRPSVVRVMPNSPVRIAQGMSAISLGRYAHLKDKRIANAIFSCVGEVVEVKEDLMNAVTAISGSGPAYFFYLIERLILTAKELGISGKTAERLVKQTALGSAMLAKQSGEKPQILKQQVASRGGTTEAALRVLNKMNLTEILRQAVRAAAKRSQQLEAQE